LAIGVAGGAARGQAAAPPANPVPPAVSPAAPPEIMPGHPGSGRTDQSASKPNDAVIPPPPNVGDSGINQRVPEIGKMPVIPPPGTPGNDSNVQPK
jgi:hypothetical protein